MSGKGPWEEEVIKMLAVGEGGGWGTAIFYHKPCGNIGHLKPIHVLIKYKN